MARILCRAAENGKDVLVLMELRARFDEAHNLAWAKQLEEAGCQVIYGMEGFKCHSKVCLITTRSRGKTGYLTQIGTGNYNEKTNAMYTDLCLMTADQAIGEDAAAFFRNMLVNDLEGKYRQLRVSPFGIREELCRRIDGQAALGREGYICIKANSVTHRAVIDRLCKASQAGAEVRLIIRGICCILPGVPGYTDNIHITSVVGRYLEHARVYVFGRGEEGAVYLSSADLMTRNLDRRVEIACPVHDPQLKQQLRWMLESQLRDNVKASDLLPDGTYARRHGGALRLPELFHGAVPPHAAPAPAGEKKSGGERGGAAAPVFPRAAQKIPASFRQKQRTISPGWNFRSNKRGECTVSRRGYAAAVAALVLSLSLTACGTAANSGDPTASRTGTGNSGPDQRSARSAYDYLEDGHYSAARTGKIRDQAGRAERDFTQDVRDMLGDTEKAAKDIGQDVKDAGQDVKNAGEKAAGDVTNAAKEAKNGVENTVRDATGYR